MLNIYGVLHFLGFIIITIYPFIMKKSIYDFGFIYFSVFVFLSWMFLNGDCFITYVQKIAKDPTYYAGKDPLNNEDMYFLDNSREWMDPILHVLLIVWMFSLFIAIYRQKYPLWLASWLSIIPFIYLKLLGMYQERANNSQFQFVQALYKWILIVGIFIFALYVP